MRDGGTASGLPCALLMNKIHYPGLLSRQCPVTMLKYVMIYGHLDVLHGYTDMRSSTQYFRTDDLAKAKTATAKDDLAKAKTGTTKTFAFLVLLTFSSQLINFTVIALY